jgi:hypothetical protein
MAPDDTDPLHEARRINEQQTPKPDRDGAIRTAVDRERARSGLSIERLDAKRIDGEEGDQSCHDV